MPAITAAAWWWARARMPTWAAWPTACRRCGGCTDATSPAPERDVPTWRPMTIRIVRLGTPRTRGEGPRLGTVRRPPRGVPKQDFAKRDFYDVWLPALSPSPDLVAEALQAASDDDERA